MARCGNVSFMKLALPSPLLAVAVTGLIGNSRVHEVCCERVADLIDGIEA